MEEKKQKTIGRQLGEQRVLCGLTQRKLKEKSGISLFTIASLEQGRLTETSTHTLRQLSKALNNYIFEL